MTDLLFFSSDLRRPWGARFERMFPAEAQAAIEEANRLCVSDFNGFHMGQPINWLYNPTGDKEFTWGINRFKHLRQLGIAYAVTGHEKYASAALEHIEGWIQTQPCPRHLPAEELLYFQQPGPWRLLETGLRLRQWVYAYHFFQSSARWTPSFEQCFFHSIKEHADFLYDFKASIEINHSIMHMIGLLSAALTFETWEDSEKWRQDACARLEQCMRAQVLDDGAHSELTPHYHMVSLELFVDCAVMLKKRGYRFSGFFDDRIYRMVSFSRCMTRIDGKMAPFADSNAKDAPDLNAAALYFERPEWMLREALHEQFWTVGPDRIQSFLTSDQANLKESHPPVPFAFPSAGYYGMGNERQKLIFDAAALGGPHGHADALSFEYGAFGKTLFVDPGVYTYMETPWRRYFKSTSAHNTVLVDGQDQTPYLRTQSWGTPEARVKVIAWNPESQMICAEHDGYRIRGVTHRRTVWFPDTGEWIIYDWLTGTGTHTYQHRLHSPLLEWEVSKLSGQAGRFLAQGSGLRDDAEEIGCDLLLFGPASMKLDIEDGWESHRTKSKLPLKVVQGLVRADTPVWFITVIRPSGAKEKLTPEAWTLQAGDPDGPPVLRHSTGDAHQEYRMITNS
ncbi:alginate lyase family protein [Cohnella sp. GCM10012308]|uniref:alginate lyase family protein n=1 Tax=Cohnella sp. GCM10012308 TaxID=3317329 RepID=UPI003612AAB4